MKPIIIKFWLGHKIVTTFKMNPEGRLSYNILPEIIFDRLTIEPDDPDSKVTMTHYGAKYSP
jgi:hypothetical protein